jgi:uncharacterized protein (DUF433 family)
MKRITVNPHIHFGEPCVAGTRIPVQDVLELVKEGIPFAEIIRDYYPDLETEDIRACIEYALESTTNGDTEWLQAATRNPAFESLQEPEEDIYSLHDGRQFHA